MKSIVVKLFGPLRQDLGVERVALEGSVEDLLGLVDLLAARYGEAARAELLDEEGCLDHAYAVFVDGERASELSFPSGEGAEVVITSMLAGG